MTHQDPQYRTLTMKECKMTTRFLEMTVITVLIFGLQAYANASAIVASHHQMAREAQQEAEIHVPPQRNDGFIEASAFYRDGPLFRVCPEQKEGRVSAAGTGCRVSTRVREGFLDWKTHSDYIPGISMQEYLDQQFGKGVTEFAGVSTRMVSGKPLLVIFYKVPAGGAE